MVKKFKISGRQLSNLLENFSKYQSKNHSERILYKNWKELKLLSESSDFISVSIDLSSSNVFFNSSGNSTVLIHNKDFREFFQKEESKGMYTNYLNTDNLSGLTTDRLVNSGSDYAAERYVSTATKGAALISDRNECLTQHNYSKNKKEEKGMNKMLKGFEFGKLNMSNLVRLSHLGLAIKNKAGVFVSYDKKAKNLVDVDLFDFDAGDMIYKMPVAIKEIEAGDVVFHNGIPMIVIENSTNITAIDPVAGEQKIILPARNMFGFNYVTKITSLIDMTSVGASTDNPFGNMLPLMLLSDKSGDNSDMFMMMMLMGQNGAGLDMSNPMMMMALMGDGNKDMMLPLLMMGGFPKNTNTEE